MTLIERLVESFEGSAVAMTLIECPTKSFELSCHSKEEEGLERGAGMVTSAHPSMPKLDCGLCRSSFSFLLRIQDGIKGNSQEGSFLLLWFQMNLFFSF